MLPQSQALELVSADKAGVATKRGADVKTGLQHGRGETASNGSVTVETQKPSKGNLAPLTGRVFVLDKNKEPLAPTTPVRATQLLKSGRAVVHHKIPLVIRLKDVKASELEVTKVDLNIDPGSVHTGLAIYIEENGVRKGLWLAELIHRGLQIKLNLHSRAALRRGRRSRNLRYRKPRWNNRARHPLQGLDRWLPPSIAHRVISTLNWVKLLSKWVPIRAICIEDVKFDIQLLNNPNISGIEYQQGTLFGYELREYLLEKFGRKCIYCGKENVPLNIEHIVPKSKGGTDKVSNLAIACIPCNQKKSDKPLEVFLAKKPELIAKIKKQLKAPLRDAAAVNSTRGVLVRALRNQGFEVKTGSGGLTKYNRTQFGVPKTHAIDALCVGNMNGVVGLPTQTLEIKSTGRGSYARTRSDKYGFPRLKLTRQKQHFGFITGDIVKANVTKGRKAGSYFGKVAVRSRGIFNINTSSGIVSDINHRDFTLLQRGNGYAYQSKATL